MTEWMRSLREEPLEARRSTYVAGRLDEQIDWYTRSAIKNEVLARRWSQATIALQTAGILAASMKAVGVLDLDLVGVAAAAAAAAIAWLESKDHSQLAEAYSTTAHELGLVRDQVPQGADEEDWSVFVADAESAISREHTSWLARRRAKQPTVGVI